MYARALLPNLANPVESYPALAIAYLPPVVRGLFYLGLLATVMSTVDGYTFIGGVNFGRDILWRWRREKDERHVNRYVQYGFLTTAVVALALALFFRSAVDLWHDVGSVAVPALLVPLASSYSARRRMSGRAATASMLLSGAVALAWLSTRYLPGRGGAYLLSLEPIYAGLVMSVIVYGWDRARVRAGTSAM
jgi:SSS family solute:Na+ symporter